MPVPRAKTRTISKMAKARLEQASDSLDATTKQSGVKETAPAKAGRPRGRPAAVHKVTKSAQRGKRQGDQATEALTRRGPLDKRAAGAQENDKRRGEPLEEIENSATVKQRQRRGSRRSRSASGDDQDDTSKSPEETVEDMAETQDMDPMVWEQVSGELGKFKDDWSSSQRAQAKDQAVTNDTDAASLHRRFNELSKRHESLQDRHRELQEVGIKAAEVNFQRLRQQTDENTRASEKLISHLREELAAQFRASEKAEVLRQQLELSQAEVKNLRANLETTNNALSESKSENKAMSVKLTASRTNEINAKAPNTTSKSAGPAANRAFQETLQTSQAKEDMYGDLTGLIVRDLKRGQKEDVFDCIQTGRNGSIHFKLGVEKSVGSDYEDVQFTYRPQLDANRDSEVIEMLPDYLTEEITFPRGHASKFYTRLTKALTERPE